MSSTNNSLAVSHYHIFGRPVYHLILIIMNYASLLIFHGIHIMTNSICFWMLGFVKHPGNSAVKWMMKEIIEIQIGSPTGLSSANGILLGVW